MLAFILTTCSHCQQTTGPAQPITDGVWPARLAGNRIGDRAGRRGVRAAIHPAVPAEIPGRFNEFPQAQTFMQFRRMKACTCPAWFSSTGRATLSRSTSATIQMSEGIQEKSMRGLIEKILKSPAAAGSPRRRKGAARRRRPRSSIGRAGRYNSRAQVSSTASGSWVASVGKRRRSSAAAL